MTNRILIVLLLTIFQLGAAGQIKLAGIIIDKTTRLPVEYANIGIPEKGVGTVCNSQGRFELFVPGELVNYDVIVSHIGYESATIKTTQPTNPLTLKIELNPSSITLKEVSITSSQQVNSGYQPGDDKVKGFFKAAGLGLEGGTLIQNTGNVKLTQFNLNILKIPFDSLKFRLNIYSIKKGNPSAKLNTRDIIFTIRKSDIGKYTVPLNDENIQVTDDFICTIELIELFGQNAENAEFLFSAIPAEDGFIYKKTISFGCWERIKKYRLCFWLTGEK